MWTTHPEFADASAPRWWTVSTEEGLFADRLHAGRDQDAARDPAAGRARPQQFNGRFQIPTFAEVIDLVRRKSREEDRRIGIYPGNEAPDLSPAARPPARGPAAARRCPRRAEPSRRAGVHPVLRAANLRTCAARTRCAWSSWSTDSVANRTAPSPRAAVRQAFRLDVAGDGERRRTFGFSRPRGSARDPTYADGIGPWKPYIISPSAATRTTTASAMT